jgi:Excreted virulence factor EspC, type VII ESX diderm
MEPGPVAARPNRMFADTVAIRALGSASSSQAADLTAITTTLSSLPVAAAASTLGPVAARFLSALADATENESRAVAALGERVAAGGITARASATAYDNADHQFGTVISEF